MRIFQDHLTLVSQKKGMRCEADVEILLFAGVPADRPVVVETQISLFADFLCNPLWKVNRKLRAISSDGETIDFVATPFPSLKYQPIGPLPPGEWRIKFGPLKSIGLSLT